MSFFLQRIKEEPVAFQAIIQAILTAGMAFGLHLTVEQMGTLLILSGSLLAFFTRQHVTSNPEVAKQVQVALNTPAPEKTIT